ncbi:MAG TPA: Mur ligase family protein [Solirubrobacteraceae bacterium]|nr:Mur ligase family protein [Solirubrobacteraceae bacterium]
MSSPEPREGWSAQDAERHLLALERFGMHFGLDRMHRLLNVLELPRLSYPTIHVVGTNGKSSTTRMIAALLEREGLHTGCFTSPHLLSYRERIEIGEREIAPERFAAAVARTIRAAELVDRTASVPGDAVTQFELLTAAALVEFERCRVDVAVLEAGLGGRYDATNVVDSAVAVLTNVGLEHTRYLGPTVTHIAREKLDVLRPGATLVLGSGIDRDALGLALETARQRRARVVVAAEELDVELRAGGGYQRRNFAAACAAASAFLGRELDGAKVAAVAASLVVPGRFQVLDGAPVTLLDGAHNDGGIEALTQSLPAFAAGRRLVAVVSILDDKDAAGMLAQLLAHVDAVVATACTSPRALPAATLASLVEQIGGAGATVVAGPHRALARARELAGEDGVVLATGSIYLIADLLRAPGSRGSSL